MSETPDRIRTEPVPAVGEQWEQPAYSERTVTVTRVDDSPRGLLVTFRWRPDPSSGWMSAQLPVAQFRRAYQHTAVAECANQPDLRQRIYDMLNADGEFIGCPDATTDAIMALVQPRLDKAATRGEIWKAKAVEMEKDRDRLAAELDEMRELVQTQARACLDHHEPIAAQRNAAERRVAELEEQLDRAQARSRQLRAINKEKNQALRLAHEFRVPCPQPDPRGHSDIIAHRKPDDLLVRRRTDGQGDGWLILNPNRQPGDHVWTGSEWVYRGELHRDVIYKWDLDEALEVAPELAVEETGHFEAWVAQMRAERGQQ